MHADVSEECVNRSLLWCTVAPRSGLSRPLDAATICVCVWPPARHPCLNMCSHAVGMLFSCCEGELVWRRVILLHVPLGVHSADWHPHLVGYPTLLGMYSIVSVPVCVGCLPGCLFVKPT